MSEKTLKTRIIQKNDSAENWSKATNFVAKTGELILINPDSENSYTQIKVGNDTDIVPNLPVINPQSDYAQSDETAADFIKNKYVNIPPIYNEQILSDTSAYLHINLEDLENFKKYGFTTFNGDYIQYNGRIVMFKFIVIADDGTEKQVGLYTALGDNIFWIYKNSTANTIKLYFSNENYSYKVDLSSRATSDDIVTTTVVEYLSTMNERAYTPTGDYTPATKKYVDDAVASLTDGSTTVAEATHATSADSATEATHATSADSATTAETATKATQDADGNVISETYQTITDDTLETTSKEVVGAINELNEKSTDLIINLSTSSSNTAESDTYDITYYTYTIDKTVDEIIEAYNSGRKIVFQPLGQYAIVAQSSTAYNHSATSYVHSYASGKWIMDTYELIINEFTKIIECKGATRIFTHLSLGSSYSDLSTTDKTIVGAINELNDRAPIVVNFTKADDGTITADKTVEEIRTYKDTNRHVIGMYAEAKFEVVSFSVVNSVTFSRTSFFGATLPFKQDLTLATDGTVTESFETATLQTKKDDSLETEATTIVGAINEVNEKASTQSDWNQNDESAIDYIKNRPFYTSDPYPNEIANGTFTFQDAMGDGSVYATELGESPEWIVGDTVTVTFDGTEYNLTTKNISEQVANVKGIYAGNFSIVNTMIGTSLEDTGEPFMVTYSNGAVTIFTASTETSHDVSVVYGTKIDVIKIEEKYLPNSVLNKNTVGKSTTGIIYTIDDVEVTAKTGAEIFNNYTNNIASGDCSHAEGSSTTASGDKSHAEGYLTTASGVNSHAEGQDTTASGSHSHAEGYLSTASGFISHAEGNRTTASSYYSHAEGSNTTASGFNSHAEGYQTTASGDYSHAEGYGSNTVPDNITSSSTNDEIITAWNTTKFTLAKGHHSHAEGNNTLTLGYCSHAEGYETTASGNSSHAEGQCTTASESYSHAEGYYTTASGKSSHAEGAGTIASGEYQHVQGKYNVEDTANTYAHIVGNGTSAAKSNVHTLDWDGNAWYRGDVLVGGTSQTDASTLATETYVDTAIANLVDSAPETMNTLAELATAIDENADVVDTLNSAIGSKANASDLTSHTGNTSNPHSVTKAQVGLGDVENKSSATIRGELTKANVTDALGYTPPTTDTTYSQATSSALGLVKIGYTESGKNYPVELNSSGQMYVNVPWTDNNTTYTSLKNPYALTIQGNGTTLTNGTYDGSAAKTVNITPSSIGAAASSHTHDYAASSHTHSTYVNQNAFSNVTVGSTTIAADSATDTLTLVGSNVTLTPDATNDKVTIGITKANVTAALGYTPPTTDTTYSAAGSSLGLVKSGGDVTISSGVITVNDDSHNHTIANVDELQTALDGKANSSHNHSASDITSGTLPIARGGTGATTAQGAATNLGVINPNLIINGDFQVWQRGNLFANISNQYTADRWLIKNAAGNTDTVEWSVNAPIGEPMKYSLHITEGLTENSYLRYMLEDALVDSTYTLSFWYQSTVDFNSYIYDSEAWVHLGKNLTSSEWTRVSFTFTAASVSQLSIIHAMSAGDIYITGIKLEVGSIATPFAPRPFIEELVMCQRYYLPLSLNFTGFTGKANSSTLYVTVDSAASNMRVAPTFGGVSNIYGCDAQTLLSTSLDANSIDTSKLISQGFYTVDVSTGDYFPGYATMNGYYDAIPYLDAEIY